MATYDAFISYSHAKDKPIAAALQSVIQKLGKPWYRRRALRGHPVLQWGTCPRPKVGLFQKIGRATFRPKAASASGVDARGRNALCLLRPTGLTTG